ncbi:hypothetical protein ACOSQ3_004192 [Xanthoceras sorbifolium]
MSPCWICSFSLAPLKPSQLPELGKLSNFDLKFIDVFCGYTVPSSDHARFKLAFISRGLHLSSISSTGLG